MAAKSLAASLSVAARDFGSLLTYAKTHAVGQFFEAPMIDSSIPMMADLYRGAGVNTLQGLEASVKANFYEAQVRKSFLKNILFPTLFCVVGSRCLGGAPRRASFLG